MTVRNFPELFAEAERHDDYWIAGVSLAFTEAIVREMERQKVSRTELARRISATPAYVTKILRGKVNFTLATMVRLARALGSELEVRLTAPGKKPSARRAGSTKFAGDQS